MIDIEKWMLFYKSIYAILNYSEKEDSWINDFSINTFKIPRRAKIYYDNFSTVFRFLWSTDQLTNQFKTESNFLFNYLVLSTL